MAYVYQTISFIGYVNDMVVKPEVVAKQLNDLINEQALAGWDFYQVNSVNIHVNPGCIAALFGVKGFEKKYDMVIFRKSIEQVADEMSVLKNKLSEIEEKKAALIKPLDSDNPRFQDIKRAALNDLSKLQRNGYQLISTEITPTTECWVLMSQLDSTKFEMKSLKELSEFASNFK
jgi:hypothetical protein